MKIRAFGNGEYSFYLDHRKIKSLKRKYKGIKYVNELIKHGKKVKEQRCQTAPSASQ